MHNYFKKFSISLESDEGLEELLKYLFQKKPEYFSKEKERITNRLPFIRRRMGFKSYVELLDQISNNKDAQDRMFQWLEKETHKVNQLLAPLRQHKKIIPVCTTNTKKKKILNKTKRTDLSHIRDYFEFKEPSDPQNIPSILDFLSKKNVNFQAYKRNYFLRRLQIRMRKANAESFREYRKFLETNPKEINSLVDCLSVNVTRFFRDRELFSQLERDILPKIFKNKGRKVRIWSAGCAVGPEPYSIAMMLNKINPKSLLNKVQILATDLSQDFLNQAIKGIYSKEYLDEMDPSQIQLYFKVTNREVYELSPLIKSAVTFKWHDLRTQPLTRDFDLIMCRNVLIYFSRQQGKTLFQRFHSVLKPKGYLVLGKCELVSPQVKNLFENTDVGNRIYQKKD